ncbi:MAG TPA: type II toxin-antitoxin system antitoxin SocA domain-containing protein, partial [Acidobacteriaceae bacterium]|nr:type II toxin-antitoxin system antitoxin SocA domain-containing protein [Acidobacteriaceae bacterium]
MKHTSASDIAKYFIASFQKKNKAISNLKLQKLLYYAQAWHLALYGSPLFSDSIEAWVHGPVVP